ncbi:glutathione ABC transporter substrate-binding protein [Bradyrhizobium sp. CCBAU 11386]|uniref:ABC transporter substrate-binding protein n=1 Tax=Bradyrhizobium sp. CCBAU 11386 TaxID=1630837 RepID=UPI0023030A1D|nr:ABC transporter substrate-binding protein [Bradyrhizobium sp. CCBAU 11386]MDA9505029.1 glutathione ABC transporter substrate-binding protein [Bradyrhizobium sp. CCBAU 11386]
MIISRLFAVAFGLLALNTTISAQTKNTIVAALAAEGEVLDPTRSIGGADQYFIGQMFEQLVRFDPNLKMVNWLAESWSIEGTADKPIIDVHLRKGVNFHNGDPLTSADFEFSYERLRDPKISRFSYTQANVERFEIVDNHHFKLHFKAPDGNYIPNALQLWAIPKKYFEKAGEEGFAKAPVGTGPWKFVSRSIKEDLKLAAFDDYWNKDARPKVKNLVLKIIPDDVTRLAAFKSGAVDWIDAVPLSEVNEIKKMPGVAAFTAVSRNNLYIDFPAHKPDSPFSKLKVRQAVAHAVDVDAIIKSVLFGQGERYVEVGMGEAGYDPNLQAYPYDVKKAKELLAEAGYPNGFETPCYNLITPREPNVKEMGEAVFAYLGTVGIRCKVQGLEYLAWSNLAYRGLGHPEMDGIMPLMWAHGLPGDPGEPWSGMLHSFIPGTGFGAVSHSEDPKADAMVEALKNTMNPEKRVELIKQIARYKHERVLGGVTTYRPIITLAWRDDIAFRPWPWPGLWRQFQEASFKE